MPVARDGLKEMVISTALLGSGGAICIWAALTVSAWYWLPAIILLSLWLFTIAFFRDPDREIPMAPGLLIAPADGKVTEVSRLENHDGIDGPALKISIFLSVFDVHINRSPCDGRVLRSDYRPGEFLDARHPECGIRNENNTIIIDPAGEIPGPVIVRQVAGLIARRIVCNVSGGVALKRGQRFGLIKFGSRTDLIVPADLGLEFAVQVNDHVKGGLTILMRMSKTPVAGGPGQTAVARSALA